ncbi:MAG: long-chain-fatty-acid--CoA ligase, partial [Mycobacterium leprae]
TANAAAPWLAAYPAEVPVSIAYPDEPLYALLTHAASDYGDRPATIFMGARLTYRELHEQALRLAAGLRLLGVKKGDRVAIMLANCPQAVIAYYGALMAGAIASPVNPLYMPRELEHQMEDCGAEVLIALDLAYPKVKELNLRHLIITGLHEYMPIPKRWVAPFALKPPKIPYGGNIHRWGELMAHEPLAEPVKVDPHHDLALIQYTGATTGLAKGCMLTHANLVANVRQMEAWMYRHKRGEPTIQLGAIPFFHVYGMTVVMNISVHMASTMVLVPRFNPVEVMKAIEKYRVTLFPGAPTMYVAINNSPQVKKYRLNSIDACISGSAPLPVEVQQEFEQMTGGRVVEGYGLTEASPVTHCNPVWGKRKEGSIGLPWPDTLARIVDPTTGKDLPVGEVGELMVKGPQVMKGYWHKPVATAEALRGGWLRTGDMARMDEEGYFYIVGRKKELIIAGGFNIYPREVEDVLFLHPAVQEAAVVGVKDEYRGETVKAYIVLKKGMSATAEEIMTFSRTQLAAYKIPRIIEFRSTLPKSIVGKVLKRALLEEEEQLRREAGGAS